MCDKGNVHSTWTIDSGAPIPPICWMPRVEGEVSGGSIRPHRGDAHGVFSRVLAFQFVLCIVICMLLVNGDFQGYYPVLTELNPYKMGKWLKKSPEVWLWVKNNTDHGIAAKKRWQSWHLLPHMSSSSTPSGGKKNDIIRSDEKSVP